MFDNRIEFSKPVHADVKEWVAEEIEFWIAEKPDWFKIEAIPDEVCE